MTPTLLALAAVVAAPALKDVPKTDDAALVGRWTLESISVAGAKMSDMRVSLTLTAGGRFESALADKVQTGTYRANPKADPPELDTVLPGPGQQSQTSRVIYMVDGDTLTVCAGADGKRPPSFDAPANSMQIRMVFRRAKTKE